MRKKAKEITEEDLYSLNIGMNWRYLKSESFAFWMICMYLFFEYVRPQSIYPIIDFLPWTQLAIIGALVGCFADRTVRWVSSSVNVLLILFLILILLSSVFAYFPSISYGKLENYYLWVIIYFLIINIVNTRKRFFIFLCIFLVASFKISLSLAISWAMRGFSFTTWGLSGPPGFFQNSGELAIQMLVFWPIAWAFAHSLKPRITKTWYWLLMLMPITAIMVILGASSRGAQLALVVQLVVMNYRTVFKPKVLISCAIAVTLLWTFLPEEQKDRFRTMGEDRTSQQRILYWENGLEMIKEHPVLGVGYFNFPSYFGRYYADDVLLHRVELPHNIIIQVGTDTGITGLAIFLILILVALRKAQRFRADGCENNQKLIGACANLSLLGFIVAGQFVTVTYYPYLWIHLALLVSMRNSFMEDSKRKKGRS
ncbi:MULTISPECIES: O-antigen ligase family protein [Marinobacter]|uniref:O-antigen ligase family protein n=1 Tax=Marinobacter TaxID=2742 RepID=UPI001246A4BA|nr:MULTISPECIES: O-antigen ligase family protein [Marinobacter]MBL3556704.1 O-antigen ligase family protein [Marinobacter sp. JB05H06]